jgi:uncharacterized protein
MAETMALPIGEPGWVDLGTSDPVASHGFYAALFGWTVDVIPDPAAGGYGLFKLDGKEVAGVGGLMNGQQRPAWTVYVLVDDADAIAARVKTAGGTVLAEPFDVMDAGRMATIADPSGAVMGLWQPGTNRGVEVMGVPGSFTWPELNSRDLPSDKLFYWSVFHWDPAESTIPGMTYTEFKLGDDSIAGGMSIGPDMPPNTPSHWIVYFAVSDTDATVARLIGLGGVVHHPPQDVPGVGRFALVADPQGAAFGLLQNTEPAWP